MSSTATFVTKNKTASATLRTDRICAVQLLDYIETMNRMNWTESTIYAECSSPLGPEWTEFFDSRSPSMEVRSCQPPSSRRTTCSH